MTKLSDLLGRGSNRFIGFPTEGVPVIGVVTSGDWVPDFTGRVRVHVFGAGGAGHFAMSARGGAAGGYCRKDITVTKGQRYACTIGAGGSPASLATPPGAGSASSFAGGGHSLVANGGAAGSASGTPAGGTASGGDINVTGGNGGLQGGGGAVGVLGAGVMSADRSGGGILPVDPGGLPGGPTLMGTRIKGVDIGNLLRAIPRDSRRPGPGIGGQYYPGYGESGGVWAGGGSSGATNGTAGAGGILGGGGGAVDTGGPSSAGGQSGPGGNGGIMIEVLSVERV